jgi:hypothetical protein
MITDQCKHTTMKLSRHNAPSLRHKSTVHCNQLKCFLRLAITLNPLLLSQRTNRSHGPDIDMIGGEMERNHRAHNNQICSPVLVARRAMPRPYRRMMMMSMIIIIS